MTMSYTDAEKLVNTLLKAYKNHAEVMTNSSNYLKRIHADAELTVACEAVVEALMGENKS